MKEDRKDVERSPARFGMTLEDLLREGARELIEKAVGAELAELLGSYENVRTLHGQQALVRNGYLPEREIMTAVGPVSVRIPKVRDRSRQGVKFNSLLVPPYVRRSKSLSAALPWLYLKGISTGEMGAALEVLVGEGAKGLSPAVVSRLKAQWGEEYGAWMKRDLAEERYIYWWADGIYSSLRSEDERLCLLVIMGVLPSGEKRFVAISDGFRESTESWKTLLRDLKDRGLQLGPRLAIGDGSLGFWAALTEVYPDTKAQRCWVHKTVNVLDCLPKSLQTKAKSELQAIFMAETREQAYAAFDRFIRTYAAKYPKAVEKLLRDREALLAYYDFPAEHWQHIRSTNPIESTFATIRHRSNRTKNCVSRNTLLGLVYRLAGEAEKGWQRIRGFERIEAMEAGVVFKDGTPITDTNDNQQLAA
jgi:putative transposase